MLANPGGTFMYAVWNQWQEEILHMVDPNYPEITWEEELIFDSDMYFRRFMYLPDDTTLTTVPKIYWVIPGASVYTADQTITLGAVAVDLDVAGEGPEIELYEWTIDGVVTTEFWSNGTKNDTCYQTRQCNVPPRTLSNGWHGFSVRGKDNDGQWSKAITKDSVLVAEHLFITHLPLTIK